MIPARDRLLNILIERDRKMSIQHGTSSAIRGDARNFAFAADNAPLQFFGHCFAELMKQYESGLRWPRDGPAMAIYAKQRAFRR
jgi:hypothetical protein